jgi:hypothetical protein
MTTAKMKKIEKEWTEAALVVVVEVGSTPVVDGVVVVAGLVVEWVVVPVVE